MKKVISLRKGFLDVNTVVHDLLMDIANSCGCVLTRLSIGHTYTLICLFLLFNLQVFVPMTEASIAIIPMLLRLIKVKLTISQIFRIS